MRSEQKNKIAKVKKYIIDKIVNKENVRCHFFFLLSHILFFGKSCHPIPSHAEPHICMYVCIYIRTHTRFTRSCLHYYIILYILHRTFKIIKIIMKHDFYHYVMTIWIIDGNLWFFRIIINNLIIIYNHMCKLLWIYVLITNVNYPTMILQHISTKNQALRKIQNLNSVVMKDLINMSNDYPLFVNYMIIHRSSNKQLIRLFSQSTKIMTRFTKTRHLYLLLFVFINYL